MACGNNKVSRSGLQSQPAQLSHPVLVPVDQIARQRALEAAKQADRQVSQAKQAVQMASSLSAVRSALQTAQRALDDARRVGGDKAARARVRDLEKQVDQLRRQAGAKESEIAGSEQQQLTAIRDSLGRDSLGVQVLTVQLPSARRTEKVRREAVPKTADNLFAQSVNHAERAATAEYSVVGKTLEAIIEDKKAAQRTLSAALRAKAPEAQIVQLKEAIRTIQRAEAKARREQTGSTGATQAGASRGPTVIHTESGGSGQGSTPTVTFRTVRLDPSQCLDPRHLEPSTRYESDGYAWETDDKGHVSRVEGNLHLREGERHKNLQADIGHRGDGRDDGGHLIASRFGGLGSGPNVVPQARDLNRSWGQWYKMEDTWAEHLAKGEHVHVIIELAGDPERPTDYFVQYTIGDEPYEIGFVNENFKVST